MTPLSEPECVVLAGPDGKPAGTADKATVHHADTPLHFAFSCWVIRDGKVLVTRRALNKLTWPGVWTNSFCGHPAPAEEQADAVVRRASFELGLPAGSLQELECVLPDFAYRAVDSSGVVENELCPVFVARLAPDVEPDPNPEEIDSYFWAPVADFLTALQATPLAFSPWAVEEAADPRLRAALVR